MKFLLLACAAAVFAAEQPNVVIILSDDQGWRDFGFMHHPQARTPNLDKLAAESLLFTRGYVPSSLCRPSLASITTGLYPHQHLITGNDPPGDARNAASRAAMVELFRKSKTIAGELGAAGYRSYQSGKWWEGECTCCGFTECMSHGDVAKGGRHGDVGLEIGRKTMQPVFDFIDRAKGKPFFLWYAPMMPHTPHNPPARLLSKYTGLPKAQAAYLAMVEWFDETVGQLLAHLEKTGADRNTLIVFLSDNGWVQLEGAQPLQATRAKLSPYDAGLRTPIFFHWKGRIAPRRDETTLVSSIDLAPTILAAAGLQAPGVMPGLNVLDAKRLAARHSLFGAAFVHTANDITRPAANLKYRWVIDGNWKLILPYAPNQKLALWEGRPETGWGEAAELYDLAADPGEARNLAAGQAARVRTLTSELDRWWTPK